METAPGLRTGPAVEGRAGINLAEVLSTFSSPFPFLTPADPWLSDAGLAGTEYFRRLAALQSPCRSVRTQDAWGLLPSAQLSSGILLPN
jgi:hypothetical protein